MIHIKIAYNRTNSFDIAQNGIQLLENENSIHIYNDPFRTIPLFVTYNQSGDLVIFSDFRDYYALENIERTFDETAFWEIVLFGSGLWTRTLYKNVQQMPAAARLIIDKRTGKYEIEKYWDFGVAEDSSINSMEMAAEGLFNRLDHIFSKLDKDRQYIMGLSGGIDSRITLAFLARHIPKVILELFTFGFDERILEYQYARQIAETLGFQPPRFHNLTIDTYKKALAYLPKNSGGQIGVNHCHIMDYLLSNQERLKNCIHLSTYYTDALFGWACKSPKQIDSYNEISYIKALARLNFISNDIKAQIVHDVKCCYANYENYKSNFSNINEYKYMSERNQKFHMYLGYLLGNIANTLFPYANYDLLCYSLSLPIIFRANKNIAAFMLDRYFKNLASIKNISSRGLRFAGRSNWCYFRLLNGTNALLRHLTGGNIQMFNKYQTEEQERLLYKYFHLDLRKATQTFMEAGVMNALAKKHYDKLPLRSAEIGERYNLLSLATLV